MPKTVDEYMAEHGDAAQALEAAVKDVNTAHSENHTARSFRRTFEPVLKGLGIAATQDGADQLKDKVESASELQTFSNSLLEVLEEMGLDLELEGEALAKQLEALPAEFAALKAEREQLAFEKQVGQLAEVAQAKASVLGERLKAAGVTAKTVEVEGKKAVHLTDQEGKDLGELRAYAEKNWADYVPALFPVPAKGITVMGQAGGSASQSPQNAITAALQKQQPSAATDVVSAFDLAPKGTV